jgi:ubiquinone/menaquinone biosynthesis C-methylase UbiE
MNTPKVSDYKNYDYKSEYWEKIDRRYENFLERVVLSQFLAKLPVKPSVLMDLGCGFGRLFPVYEPFAEQFILFDYSADLLKQAQEAIKPAKKVQFVNGNAYALPFEVNSIDCIVSIRTLHHFTDPKALFNQVYQVLKPGGCFIMEIPNKRNILQILRFILGRSKHNPFSLQPLALGDTFLNFHPAYIKNILKEQGFNLVYQRSLAFFRHPALKRFVPYKLLVRLDLVCQFFFSFLNLTPSIYLLLQKPKQA